MSTDSAVAERPAAQSERETAIPSVVPSDPPGRTRWREGKVRTAILLWALGVPIPIILVILLIRGCMT